MERWFHELERGHLDAAWDRFLGRYRRLIFATIRHYAHQPDDVMDVFARVCEALRADGMARLRRYTPEGGARFSTWLVVVIRNLAIDWYRSREGRTRLGAAAARLPALQQTIFREVFLHGRSHAEAYEVIRSREYFDLSFSVFLRELAEVYRALTGSGAGRLPRELTVRPPESQQQPDDGSASEMRRILADAMAGLGAAERLAVQLYVIDELPAAEVALLTGLANAKAVYNCVYRALATVRVELERAGYRRDML